MGQKILAQLERLAYWFQRKYMEPKMTSELVSPHFAFFHPQDKSQLILTLYQIRLRRWKGAKIVLVTGCFDILHQEHLRFLKQAQKEGNILIVGLESDNRVRKMKGDGRPKNIFAKRARNLVSLNAVDYVLKLPDNFDRQSVRAKMLRLIKPHVLAVSAQDPLEKKKRKECQTIGCQVKVVHSYNPKISTTKIISSWADRGGV